MLPDPANALNDYFARRAIDSKHFTLSAFVVAADDLYYVIYFDQLR